jgi:hypothetical protein
MTRKGTSLYIESHGPQDAAINEGFQWLLSEARKVGNKGLVAVTTKQNLDNIADWSQLGSLLTTLRQHGVVKTGEVTLGLFTAKDKGVHQWEGPILTIYGGQKLLDAVDSITGSASVLYIPWSEGDHAAWAETWGASKLGAQPTAEHSQEEPTGGVALVALRGLTDSVNLNTGIVHPSDREQAVRSLETLFHQKADVTPERIRQQLIRLGWQPKDAAEVMKLAEMIWDGRRPKGSKGKGDDNLWDYWQSKVN